jgi:hypothetical protein
LGWERYQPDFSLFFCTAVVILPSTHLQEWERSWAQLVELWLSPF